MDKIKIIFYISLTILLFYLFYLIIKIVKNENIEDNINYYNQENMKRKRSISPTSISKNEKRIDINNIPDFKITESFVNSLNRQLNMNTKKKQNMLDLYKSSGIGYPNFGTNAYVLCYMNSALQLIRTLIGSMTEEQDIKYGIRTSNNLLNKKLNTIINIINYSNPRSKNLVDKILKYIVPNHAQRIQSFYNINELEKLNDDDILINVGKLETLINIQQSDSFQFLEYFLSKIQQLNPLFEKAIQFEKISSIKDSDESTIVYSNTKYISNMLIIEANYLSNLVKNNLKLNLSELIQDNIYSLVDINNYKINNELTNAIQKKYDTNFSDYILVVLHIFQPDYKTGRHIKLDIGIDITSDKIQFTTLDNKEYNYGLISMICHSGSTPDSGHYVNFSKRSRKIGADINNDQFESMWYYYNDINVQQIGNNIKNLNNKITNGGFTPYILCFKKIE
jgi:hypothetical protein